MIVELPVSQIFIRRDARKLVRASISGLIESIREVGIINPLRVRPVRRFVLGIEADAWEVTTGRHRLEAALKLGLETVPCIIVDDDDLRAELVMIDENLMRAELDPAQRAKQTARRKAIYVELHPETRNGATGGGHDQLRQVGEAAPRFTSDTASATGKSERAIQRDAERGEKIKPEVLDRISGTDLDTGAYLDGLKKVAPDRQEAKVVKDLDKHERELADLNAGKKKRSGDARSGALRAIAFLRKRLDEESFKEFAHLIQCSSPLYFKDQLRKELESLP
jgi:ParB-like chromosome segregation protein Spo0J